MPFVDLNRLAQSLIRYTSYYYYSLPQITGRMGGGYGEETHVKEVVGSNIITRYWIDIFSHFIVVKIVKFVLERLKINEKEAEDFF